VRVLEVVGIPLGLLDDSNHEDTRIGLQPGDLLVIMSDGITETTSPAGADYDEKRLIRTIEAYPDASAKELIRAIFDDIEDFSGGASPADDRTVIVVKISE
jgi:sigma-B regulation protein RsbU (phosphoserine phosphatase)